MRGLVAEDAGEQREQRHQRGRRQHDDDGHGHAGEQRHPRRDERRGQPRRPMPMANAAAAVAKVAAGRRQVVAGLGSTRSSQTADGSRHDERRDVGQLDPGPPHGDGHHGDQAGHGGDLHDEQAQPLASAADGGSMALRDGRSRSAGTNRIRAPASTAKASSPHAGAQQRGRPQPFRAGRSAWRVISSTPRPRGAPYHSPKMAPASAAGAASLRPSMTDGHAAGSCTDHIRWNRLAPSAEATSWAAGGRRAETDGGRDEDEEEHGQGRHGGRAAVRPEDDEEARRDRDPRARRWRSRPAGVMLRRSGGTAARRREPHERQGRSDHQTANADHTVAP